MELRSMRRRALRSVLEVGVVPSRSGPSIASASTFACFGRLFVQWAVTDVLVKIRAGQSRLFCALGGGIAWGSAIVR